jgi:riboflavin kinase/FMN adenylyltransferase
MIYIGTNPTFENAGRTIEANLLDFEGDLYARELELEFVAFIRGDRRFGHVDELVRQMAEDERNIRACIAAASPEREVSSVR